MKSRMLLLFILLSSLLVYAQAPTYEVRAVNKGTGFVGVEIRIAAGTPPVAANSLTDLVFGLKWPSSYNVKLMSNEEWVSTNNSKYNNIKPSVSTYNTVRSDERKLKNGFYYQAFSAANTPFSFPTNWQLNEWVEIMSIRSTLMGADGFPFEIIETGFDITTDPNLGVGLNDYTPVVVGSLTTVNFIKLTKFSVIPVNRMIHIKWSVTDGQVSGGFQVERSEGEADDFKKIGWISKKGNGSSNNEYEFLDKEVIGGLKYYYRLKQVDNDNNFQYSEVRLAMLDELVNKGIRIMPNPVDRMLQVFFDNREVRGKLTLKIVDAKGAVILFRRHDSNFQRNVRLDVSKLAGGSYFLMVENSNGTFYAKMFQKI